MQLPVLNTEKYNTEFMIRVLGFFLTYLEKFAFFGGKAEKWIMVNDLKGVGITKMPVNVIQTQMLELFNPNRP